MTSLTDDFVDLYFRGDPNVVTSFIRKIAFDHPDRHAYFALAEVLQILNFGKGEFKIGYRLICEAIDKGTDDPDLYALLLLRKLQMAVASNDTVGMSRTVRFLKTIDKASLIPTIAAHLYCTESHYYASFSATESAQQCLDSGLAMNLPEASGVRAKLLSLRLSQHLSELEIDKAKELNGKLRALYELLGKPKRHLETSARIYSVVGEYRKAVGLYEELCRPAETPQEKTLFLGLLAAVLLKLGDIEKADSVFAELTGLISTEAFKKNDLFGCGSLSEAYRASRLIRTNRHAEARDRLHTLLRRPDKFLRHIDFFSILLCEAEFGLRNPRAVRTILEMLDRNEELARLRGLWARLYWFEGDKERAARHFKFLVDKNIPGLIRDQLIFATELPPADLIELTQLANEFEEPPLAGKRPSRKLPAVTDTGEKIRFIGKSSAAEKVRERIERYAPLDKTVLITGETGTGKEIVAKLLHRSGPRAAEPFIPVNCASLSETLIHSELFGHVKGAFTGASGDHPGLFLAAGKGTIFLDEINAMPPALQASLLRALETMEIRPVGGASVIPFSARVIAASNQSLEKEVAAGNFRADLYYRLAKLHISIPPLAARREDIPDLVEAFLRRIFHGQKIEIEHRLLEALRDRNWPGNVRELENEVERIGLTVDPDGRIGANTVYLSESAIAGDFPEIATAPPEKTAPDPSGANPAYFREALNYSQARQKKLRELFDTRKKLTRADAVRFLGCAPDTATRDLRTLEQEGYIRRVITSAHARTSYFVKT